MILKALSRARDVVKAHLIRKTVHEVIADPEHGHRTESAEYRHNRHVLLDRLDLPCLVCGTRQQRQTHHIFEWMSWKKLDPRKVLRLLRIFDPYGFAHHMGDKPVESPDDIRNLLVLCEKHHIRRRTGVHETTFPPWYAQAAARDGDVILE